MKRRAIEICAFLAIAGLFGCSAVGEGAARSQPSLSTPKEETKGIPLERKTRSPVSKVNPVGNRAQVHLEFRREVPVSALVEGSITRDEIIKLLGPPKTIESDRLIYEIWTDRTGEWRVGGRTPIFHPQYSEWTAQAGRMELVFDERGILLEKELPPR